MKEVVSEHLEDSLEKLSISALSILQDLVKIELDKRLKEMDNPRPVTILTVVKT